MAIDISVCIFVADFPVAAACSRYDSSGVICVWKEGEDIEQEFMRNFLPSGGVRQSGGNNGNRGNCIIRHHFPLN